MNSSITCQNCGCRISSSRSPVHVPKNVTSQDADRALTQLARAICCFRNWPCEDDAGGGGFRVKVQYHSVTSGVSRTDEFHVAGHNGVLTLTSPVIEVPNLPIEFIVELVNDLNLRSIGAALMYSDSQIFLRQAIAPRSYADGVLTTGMLVQTLRQISVDRRNALTVLRHAFAYGSIAQRQIDAAFAQPCAPSGFPTPNQEQAAQLAAQAHYHWRITDCLELSGATGEHPVRVQAGPGFLRGLVVLHAAGCAAPSWAASFDKLVQGAAGEAAILQNINDINREASLARLVYYEKQLMALATCYPTDQVIGVDQFKTFGDALLNIASGVVSSELALLAIAGPASGVRIQHSLDLRD